MANTLDAKIAYFQVNHHHCPSTAEAASLSPTASLRLRLPLPARLSVLKGTLRILRVESQPLSVPGGPQSEWHRWPGTSNHHHHDDLLA